MVKRNKKNTKDTPRKKTKASTTMDDSRKDLSADFDIAVSLPQTPQDFQPVSTSLPPTSEGIPSQSAHNPSDSATILAYLKKIDASNEALTKRVQDLEANRLGSQHQTIPGRFGETYCCRTLYKIENLTMVQFVYNMSSIWTDNFETAILYGYKPLVMHIL